MNNHNKLTAKALAGETQRMARLHEQMQAADGVEKVAFAPSL